MPVLVNNLAQRYPVYVVTGNSSEVVTAFLREHGIGGVREVLGSDVERSKVKKIRRVKRLHPDGALFFITDTSGDLREAHKAGAVPVAVTWGYHSVATLQKAHPQHVVESPESLRLLFA